MTFNYEQLTTHFGHIFPTHVEELCELLIVLRQQFFGDLDLMLILAIVGSRALPARRATAMTYQEFLTRDRLAAGVQPINIQSVAECSGIARETVRRKVKKLSEHRLINRDEDGMLSVTEKATQVLSLSTEASLQYMAALGEAYSQPNKVLRNKLYSPFQGMPQMCRTIIPFSSLILSGFYTSMLAKAL